MLHLFPYDIRMIIGDKCVQMLQQPTAVKMCVATASLAPLGQA